MSGPARVEVHLAAPGAGLAAAALGMLSPAERERDARFQHAGAREQFLVGRWLLRTVLGERLGCAPGAVPLVELARGALAVAPAANPRELRCNLSHTAGLVAVAVAEGAEVGVDVEDADRVGRTVELADRFFAPAEVTALRALDGAAQRGRFFALWTLKEAYIKARGQGLGIPLARFAFDLQGAGAGAGEGAGAGAAHIGFTVDPAVDADVGRWRFARFRPTPRHALAVALGCGPRPLIVRLRWRAWGEPT